MPMMTRAIVTFVVAARALGLLVTSVEAAGV
jgi:hypothetical protein